MRCPECAAPTSAIEATAGLAHCSVCGHVWEVPASVAPTEPVSAPAPPRPRPMPPVPAGVDVQRNGRTLEVLLPWGHDRSPLVHGLLGAALFVLALVPGVSSVLWSGLLVALWVALTRNITRVVIEPERVTVSHAPVPWPFSWSGTVSAERLTVRHLHRRSEHQAGSYGTTRRSATSYGLRAGSVSLLDGWRHRERIAYVDACIGQHVEAPIHAEPAAHPLARPGLVQPAGIEVTEPAPGELELQLPWNAHVGPKGVHLLWVLILPAIGSGSLGTLVGLVVFGLWLYLSANHTKVSIRPTGVDITHGPLPNPLYPDTHWRPAELGAMRITEQQLPIGRYRTTTHSLVAGGRPLLQHWVDPEKARFVQAAIEDIVQGGPSQR